MSGPANSANRHLAWGVVSTLLGAVSWGFSGTCVQYLFATTDMSPLLLTAIRQLGAGIVFVAYLFVRHRDTLRGMLADRTTMRRLLLFGSMGLFLNSAAYAATIAYTNAGTATVLQSLSIVFVLAYSCLANRRAPRLLETTALACALAATFLIATHADITTIVIPLPGLLYGLLNAMSAAFYTTYSKKTLDRWGSLATTGLGMLVGGIVGTVACLATGVARAGLPALDATGVIVLAVAVFVGTCGAYGLYLHGVSIVGPVAGSMLGAAEPVSATVIGALWLATPFVWADWAGLVLMVATIILIALQGKDQPSA